MKENNFTEKESLELIAKMIQQTKQSMQIGGGNILLYYGYASVIIAVSVYALCHFTSSMYWHYLWFLMFILMIIEKITKKKRKTAVVTYIDKAVTNVWVVICMLFNVTLLSIVVIGAFTKAMPFTLLLPLSLLYTGIGTACTGVITNERSMALSPVISFVISIYMLVTLAIGGRLTLEWNLLGGLAFFMMLVIPGHILNSKSQKQCSKS